LFTSPTGPVAETCMAMVSRVLTIRMQRPEIATTENGMMGKIGQSLIGQATAAVLIAAATLALTPTEQAFAQGAVRSVHNDWQVRCDTPPGAQTEQCALIQSVTAEDRPNIGLTVIILKTADKKTRLMRVIAPPGVLLPSGLGLKIDNAEIGRAGFVRCVPNGCVAEVIMDDNLVSKLRTGQSATFIIFQTPEEGIGFPIALKGFGEGFDKLP
jgi:invasion protein IalB